MDQNGLIVLKREDFNFLVLPEISPNDNGSSCNTFISYDRISAVLKLCKHSLRIVLVAKKNV